MSKQIAVARINATGALIPLHDNNRLHILNQPGVVETVAEACTESGKLVEVNGAEGVARVVASLDLKRITDALDNNRRQREQLLTAALKLPGADAFLQERGVYLGEDDPQYMEPQSLDVNTLGSDTADPPVIENVTEQLAKQKAAQNKRKKPQGKKPDLSEL